MDAKQVWRAALGELQVSLSPANFETFAGAVWVGSNGPDDTFVFRIDPATNRFTKVAVGQKAPDGFATDGRQLWSVNGGSDSITKIDPATNAPGPTVKVGSLPTSGVFTPDGRIWIPNRRGGTISVVDPSSRSVVDTIQVGPTPFPLRLAYGDVWVPIGGGREIWRIRP